MSDKKKHRHHSETKRQIRARRVLAFFLFLCISLLSLSLCLRVFVVSKGAVINALTSETYVSGVCENTVDFAHDLCDECAVPYECVDSAVNYDSVYRVQKAYFNGILSASNEFTDTTYLDYIEEIGKNIENDTRSVIKESGIPVDGDLKKDAALFSAKITEYLISVTEMPYMQRIKTVLSIGSTASVIVAAGVALVAIVLALFIVSIGKKLYRALREIAYSFYAAALLDIVLVIGVEGVKHFKTLLLYPEYFCSALMEYVNRCIEGVCISSVILFVLALVVTSVVWALKRNENN